MGIDPILVATDMIDAAHDQEFFAQRLQWFEYTVVSFGLQRGRNAKAKEDVEGANGGGRSGGLYLHFLKKRQADGDRA